MKNSTKEKELFKAVMGSDLEAVKKLVADGVNINARDEDGQTPLFIASGWFYKGNIDVVNELIKAGADINARHWEGGETVLMKAAEVGNIDVVNELIKAGADINVKYWDGDYHWTALEFASTVSHGYNTIKDRQKKEIVKILKNAGAEK